MVHVAQENSADISSGERASSFPLLGGAAFDLQKQWFQIYQRLSHVWLERFQAQTALWAKLMGDLASSKTGADITEAYTEHIARQIRMTAEGSRDIAEVALKSAGPRQADTHAIYDPGPEAGFDFTQESSVKH